MILIISLILTVTFVLASNKKVTKDNKVETATTTNIKNDTINTLVKDLAPKPPKEATFENE